MRLRAAAAAAGFYLAVALWALRLVLPAPASPLAYLPVKASEPASVTVTRSDQMFDEGVAWVHDPGRVEAEEEPGDEGRRGATREVLGNHWTPLALLFAHRLFVFARWRDAAGLVVFIGLQLLESFYQIAALALLGSVVAVWLRARQLRRLLAPKLLAAAAAVAVLAAAITVPYLQTRRVAITAGLAGATLLEVFAPPLARRSFGAPVEMTAYELRLDPRLVALLENVPAGAVLDLPFELNLVGELRDMAHYVFLSAFHDHPVAACFNSYKLPIDKDIAALARRLSDPRAADALAALGFGSIVLHEELEPKRVAPVRGALDQLVRSGGRLTPIGEAAGHRVYRLSSPLPVDASLAALAPGGSPAGDAEARAPLARIEFAFRNTTDAIYRHPDPIVPAKVLVRWYADGGALAAEQHTRLLLPLALAPGEEAVRAFVTPVPTGPGLFEVTLAPETAPERVLARQRVRVEPS